MALDRDATLKKAEKLLRQGRLDRAIAEYVRVVEDNPRDWSTANTLGELYARAGQPITPSASTRASPQHFVDDGFYPKAAALYKKILKINPHDEATQIAARGHLRPAGSARRREVAPQRGGRAPQGQGRPAGARPRSSSASARIDPPDFDARLAAARMLEQMGEEEERGKRFRALHDDLLEKGRTAEAIDALK